ncbi:MAG TPA: MBL fold metallo-hydrolase [Spirochaetota bacterium]|nr:MBL fold metallo-hydrolase [Spirochaetota bacterium]
MKKTLMICLLTLLVVYASSMIIAKNQMESIPMVDAIHWLGHDTFKIVKDIVIYIDPFKIKNKDNADIILITHEHFDHCSPGDIKKLQTNDTIIIASKDCIAKLSGNVKAINPGKSIVVKGITIEAIPAYNTNKQFHPRSNQWVGYIITIDSMRIYMAGDTDYIPEMKSLKNITIALLPVSGVYVMTADEAAQAALAIKPEVAIPMHYGSIVGTIADAKKFESLLKGKVQVVIKKQEN